MNIQKRRLIYIPEEQLRVRAKCWHPTGDFEEFKEEYIEQSIVDRYRQVVKKFNDRLAVKDIKQRLTYGELNNAANRLANFILQQRTNKPEPVGILLEQGSLPIIAILSVLITGKFYVPLEPSYPVSRTDYILNDSGVSLILTNNVNFELASKLAKNGMQLINIDELDEDLPTHNPGLLIPPDRLAYIMYTSGSTGQPKGVIETHRNILHQTMVLTNNLRICCEDKQTLVRSFSFNGSVRDIFGSLLNGASLYPYNIAEMGIDYLPNWLIDEEITIYRSVISTFRYLMSTLNENKLFSDLRLIEVGGETIKKQDIELFKKFFSPKCILCCGLGITETGTIRNYFIDKETEISGDLVPVGYPVTDKEVILLNNEAGTIEANQIGEIAVKSRYLSKGYWNKPELTMARFLSVSDNSDERIYLTGDLGRMSSDGCLFHMGRKDFQVKIRGHRVETVEIETALQGIDNIKESIVIAQTDNSDDQYLLAYILPSKFPGPTVSSIRRKLGERLPDYMIPARFLIVDSIPVTPTGKIDRQALPAPDRFHSEPEEGFVPPRDELELQLARTWEKVLGVKPIGMTDNFFELGGHSLLAMRLIRQIEKIIDKEMPLATLFQSPTVEQLAHTLSEQGCSVPLSSLAEIATGGAGLKVSQYLPAQSRPYLRKQYHKLREQPGYLYLKRQYLRTRSGITRRFFSYRPAQLEEKLRMIGLTDADTVFMHSAFRAFNGFSGGPQQIIDCILNVIGEAGNLLMVSMPYSGATADHLRAVKTFDIIKTESSMGIITEIFRRKKHVVRSLNPAHPILAFGPDASWIISDHEKTMYSCGKGSPFEKILSLNAKALFYDVPFITGTFFHYLEDKFKDSSPVQLYDDKPLENTVIDPKGNEINVKSYVFSKEARENRSARLIERELNKKNYIKTNTIGNTKLKLVNLRDVVGCAQKLVNSGQHFYKT